jgi:hypothetical protein
MQQGIAQQPTGIILPHRWDGVVEMPKSASDTTIQENMG